jgi:TPR repeat protein
LALQVPAFSQDAYATPFFFWQGDDESDISARCSNDKNELDSLRYGVITGSVSRESIEYKRVDLAPCGHEKVVAAYLRLQQQGAGASGVPNISAKDAEGSGQSGAAESGQRCDELAASQYDKDRPEGIAGTEVQNIALAGLASDAASEVALKAIGVAIDACTQAVKEHELVARFKFNLARALYAKSILSPVLARDHDLRQVSRYVREAADLGHAAAYHMLAMLYLNGEFYETNAPEAQQPGSEPGTVAEALPPADGADGKQQARQPPDKEQARAWLQRGADLGHVLALYELGLAFDKGELDVNTDQLVEVTSEAKAYQYYSRAAESGFIPAMIQAALILASPQDTRNVPQNTNRAMEMLTQAAARGSPEAMYRMGQLCLRGSGYYDEHTVPPDENEAFIWFSRAADFGDARAQEKVADMLRKGKGLPAPQPEAAARYWRLAADGGSLSAQMQLANLLRDGQVPFRLRVKFGSDGGAEEIRRLYMGAFARGNPVAGLELAKLFRKGFPAGGKVGGKTTAIPKSAEIAVALLWETMTRIRHMPDDSDEADPENEFQAAAELLSMYDAGETNADGKALVTQDQIEQLRADYGDPAKSFWIRASSLGPIVCRRGPYYIDEDKVWVRIWDSKRLDPPTEEQFDWYEKSTACKERISTEKIKSKGKAKELGVSNKVREAIKKEYSAAAKEREKNPDTYKKFTDRMADLVTKQGKKR